MKKSLLSAIVVAGALFAVPSAHAGIDNLLPLPKTVIQNQGELKIGPSVKINDPTDCLLLRDILTEAGCKIGSTGTPVTVSIVRSIPGQYDYTLAGFDNEAYQLRVTASGIEIDAVTPTGVIRAVQTLGQLMESDTDGKPTTTVPGVDITDWPAFKLRGYMHDVGRSFIEPETLKRHIRLLSRFKVNTFHWHFTENQAWRFEVKAYPQLTSDASMTRFKGKYYTQAQIKEVIEEARRHGVTIIPEIDMPGHSEAFERAMGCEMQSARGKEILLKVLEEVVALFDKEPYIHIGADEKTITDNTFLPTMTAKVHELGKKVVCWNPIRGVTINPSSGFDMTQMWSTSGRVINGMPNIDCRYNYTNHFDVFADLVGIYKSSIYYADKGSPDIAGTISAPWNDRMTPTEEDIIRQNNFYANVLASAERAWKGGGEQYIETGGTTLPNSGAVYDEFADWERRFLFHKSTSLSGEPIPYVKQTNVRWMITDPFPNGGNSSMSFPPENGFAAQYEYNGATYGASPATGAGIYLRHTWGSIIPTFYPKTYDTGYTAYAYTWVYSPTDRQAGALIEFQNYGRSEKDTAPDRGNWDRKGSRIWLNDSPVEPPVWENSGVSINNEVPLRNENFTARKPTQVTLRAGWNKVLIKLPYVNASGVRLNKWLFTFVLTDLEGRDAMPDLIYSPSKILTPEAETLSMSIQDVKSFVNSEVRDLPGYYAAGDAYNDLMAVVAEIEATLEEDLPAATRQEQQKALNDAFTTFKATYREAGMARPNPNKGYLLSTPERGSRYLSSTGVGSGVIGADSPSELSTWMFRERTDGSYDVVNYADGSYLSPDATKNTQIVTTTSPATHGWRILPAVGSGNVILVTDGGSQLNQTNSSLGWKIYNWGDGNNTTDTGCKYQFEVSPYTGAGALVSAIRDVMTFVNSQVRDLPGYYAQGNAYRALMAVVDEIETTLDSDLPTATRDEQKKTLEDAFNTFKDTYREDGMAAPHPSTGYYLSTPERGSRYLSSTGVGSGVIGEGAPSDRSAWIFNLRPDGSYDVVNYSDGSYLSPDATKDTQIVTTTTPATHGWRILPSATLGCAILATDGGSQLNQTNAGLGWKIYNWGDGTNTTDTGCKYQFEVSPFSGLEKIVTDEPFAATAGEGWIEATSPATVYDTAGRMVGVCHSRLSLAPGIYLVTDGRRTLKVAVR